MAKSVLAVVRDGKIELLEPTNLPEGTKLVVTMLEDDQTFWLGVSQSSLDAIWDNPEDDIYAELLQR